MIDRKVNDIQAHFAALLGETITRYETAELLAEAGTWHSWPDLPIRLYTGSDMLAAISWSRFDDLWLANDMSSLFRPKARRSGGSSMAWKRSIPPSGPRSDR